MDNERRDAADPYLSKIDDLKGRGGGFSLTQHVDVAKPHDAAARRIGVIYQVRKLIVSDEKD